MVVVVPKHTTPTRCCDLIERWRRCDGLPCLVGVQRTWNRLSSNSLHDLDASRWKSRRPVNEMTIVHCEVNDLHCLVKHCPVEIIGGPCIGVIKLPIFVPSVSASRGTVPRPTPRIPRPPEMLWRLRNPRPVERCHWGTMLVTMPMRMRSVRSARIAPVRSPLGMIS